MTKATLTVDGVPVSFSNLWIQFQDVSAVPHVEYRARVMTDYVGHVFDDPEKGSNITWGEYVYDEVSEYGSGILRHYFARIRELTGDEQSYYHWVIATLDAVVEDENGIEFRGKAVAFDPSRFP